MRGTGRPRAPALMPCHRAGSAPALSTAPGPKGPKPLATRARTMALRPATAYDRAAGVAPRHRSPADRRRVHGSHVPDGSRPTSRTWLPCPGRQSTDAPHVAPLSRTAVDRRPARGSHVPDVCRMTPRTWIPCPALGRPGSRPVRATRRPAVEAQCSGSRLAMLAGQARSTAWDPRAGRESGAGRPPGIHVRVANRVPVDPCDPRAGRESGASRPMRSTCGTVVDSRRAPGDHVRGASRERSRPMTHQQRPWSTHGPGPPPPGRPTEQPRRALLTCQPVHERVGPGYSRRRSHDRAIVYRRGLPARTPPCTSRPPHQAPQPRFP
jgi:hypothetical protein